jgi:hypothetical protein
MRVAWIGLMSLVVTLATDVASSLAYDGSFFNDQYCTTGGSGHGGRGSADCSFRTWEQCVASARGLGRYCTENPFWKSEGSDGLTPRRRTGQQR